MASPYEQLRALHVTAGNNIMVSPPDHPPGPSSVAGILNTTIPSRVTPAVALEKKASEDGKRLQLVANENIAAGDLIYSIKSPLLNIVGNGEESLRITCDNCFAKRDEPGPSKTGVFVSTVPRDDVKLLACGGCKVLKYCNKKCQKAAWTNHHKHECKIISDVKTAAELGPDGKPIVYHHQFRCMARLLLLHHNEEKMLGEHRKQFAEATRSLVDVLDKYIKSGISRITLLSLACAMDQCEVAIKLPLIKDSNRMCDPLLESTLAMGGTCFDPFLSLIEHSCEPNTWIVHEGKKLRVRAMCDITADTVLKSRYIEHTASDYELTRPALDELYHIRCACSMCKKAETALHGTPKAIALKTNIDKYFASTPSMATADDIREAENAIKDMLDAGFGYNVIPMRSLHQRLVKGHLNKMDYAKALKICLRQYYLVEPNHIPLLTPSERLNTMFLLISCIGQKHLLPHLKYKYVLETKKWFGADSKVTQFEQAIFDELVENIKRMAAAKGFLFLNHVVLAESEVERETFVKDIYELLNSWWFHDSGFAIPTGVTVS
ncbi:hypothetical protein VTL71DRAFT_818 [Oculimacula yallundae]|uniref:MYND-type domain-containing protein n=1 Tax=Oculimacula yallundae TaxID=86028 RepID=A0ABR4D1C5_9HELO